MLSFFDEPMTPERYQVLRTVLDRRQPDLTVVTDEVHKGRNIAAIMRTCDSVGVDTLHVVHPKDGYRPYRGTALGSQKWVAVEVYDTISAPIAELKNNGHQVVVTALEPAAKPYWQVDYTRPTALILGSEREGVSDQVRVAADVAVTIPMLGMVESLNVSVAAAIILQEAARQRQDAGLYDRRRLSDTLYAKRFFEWAHPVVSEYCRGKGVPYPPVDDEGEIVDAANWYRSVRMPDPLS